MSVGEGDGQGCLNNRIIELSKNEHPKIEWSNNGISDIRNLNNGIME